MMCMCSLKEWIKTVLEVVIRTISACDGHELLHDVYVFP